MQAGAGEMWGKVAVADVGERVRARKQQEGAGEGVKTEMQ